MDGATIVAVASLLVTGAVSIYVPRFTTSRAERRDRDVAAREDRREVVRADRERQREEDRLVQERASRDLDEIRSLLDQFVDAMPEAINGVASLQSATGRDDSPDPARYSEQLNRLRESRDRLVHLQTRMIVRLGRSSSVVHAAQRMIEAVDEPGVEVTMRVTLEQEAPVGVPDVFVPGRQAMWESASRVHRRCATPRGRPSARHRPRRVLTTATD